MATPEGFARDPALVQAFYNARRRQLQSPEIAPNAAHQALARLEAALGDRFVLVTQNIDNLARTRGKPPGDSYARRAVEGALFVERTGAGVDRRRHGGR